MTPAERQNTKILNGSRRARIARGSGVTVTDINQLVNRFEQAAKMMKKVARGESAGIPGMGAMPGQKPGASAKRGKKNKGVRGRPLGQPRQARRRARGTRAGADRIRFRTGRARARRERARHGRSESSSEASSAAPVGKLAAMPQDSSMDPFDASSAPRALPLTYPGRRPDASVVITQDAIWEIRDREGDALAWRSDHRQRLATCRVALSVAERSIRRLSTTAFRICRPFSKRRTASARTRGCRFSRSVRTPHRRSCATSSARVLCRCVVSVDLARASRA